MGLGATHAGDNSVVQVIPLTSVTAGQAPYRRIRAVGCNQPPGTQLLAVSKGQVPAGVVPMQLFQTRSGDQLYRAAGLERLQQRILHHPVLDDMAEHFGMYRSSGKMDLPSTGAIPHTHFAVGTCAVANDTRPGTDAFEYALAGSGQCAYAGFERVGWSEGLRFKRPGINQANVQPALLQRQCQRAADHPRAHDDEVRLHHSLLRVFNDLRKGQFQLRDGTTLSLYESARAALEGLTGASHPAERIHLRAFSVAT